jgi:hypothetical protein
VNRENETDPTRQKSALPCLRWQLGLAFLAQLFSGLRAQAEDHLDYGFEYYQEDDKRMTIKTQSVDFEQKLSDSVIAKGELTYDGISGTTPTGTYHYPPDKGKIWTTQINDIRRAISLEFDCQTGRQTLTPGFAYSGESDYESYGISLSDAISFNEKNTTLLLGVSHNFDSVLNDVIGSPHRHWQNKGTTEGMIGVSQLLTPKTIFDANFTFGYSSGFLNDPYRWTEFVTADLPFGVVENENRPRVLEKETFQASITQFIEPLNASIIGSYRFYHDSYDIYASTVALTWRQWVGKKLIIEPGFRFYEQSSASFYQPLFHKDPADVGYYSSDYRLSEFYSLDSGVQITIIANDHLHLTAGYHRYAMYGLDNTSPAMYPQANVYTVGISILW